jgi:hypothetical protein
MLWQRLKENNPDEVSFWLILPMTCVIQKTPPFIAHWLKSVYNDNYLRTPCEDVPIEYTNHR